MYGITLHRWRFWKAAVWQPLGKIVTALYGLLGLALTLRELLPEDTQSKLNLHRILSALPDWSWQIWVLVFLIPAVIIALEGAYRVYRKQVSDLQDQINKITGDLPNLEVQIDDALVTSMTPNGAKCFIKLTLRNLTDVPCMVATCALGLKINGEWYKGGEPIGNAGEFRLVGYYVGNPKELQPGIPYKYDGDALLIEIGSESITDIRSVVNESLPLKRGFPRTGWIGFWRFNLPAWPKIEEPETDAENETMTKISYSTETVEEIEIEVVDGHGQRHFGRKNRKGRGFGGEWREIVARQPSPLLSWGDGSSS